MLFSLNLLRTSAACAALVFSFGVSAAIPVEESVEESTERATEDRSVGSVRTQRSTRIDSGSASATRSRTGSLGIPPTIEPTTNSDYRPGQQSTDSRSGGARGVHADTTAGSSGGGGQLSQLFYQVQTLQQEVQQLRGQIEDQEFQIKRLQQIQQEQYRDLDRRVANLSTSAAPARVGNNRPQPSTGQNPASPSAGNANPVPDRTASAANPGSATASPINIDNMSERQAYQSAFEAMKARDYDGSLSGFNALIKRYPTGQYTPNAFYWLGELHLAKSDPEQARQSFMQVVSLYPDHAKTPDALYKLGVVYATLGDNPTAMSYLNRVQANHPGSTAAGLASKYAEALR